MSYYYFFPLFIIILYLRCARNEWSGLKVGDKLNYFMVNYFSFISFSILFFFVLFVIIIAHQNSTNTHNKMKYKICLLAFLFCLCNKHSWQLFLGTIFFFYYLFIISFSLNIKQEKIKWLQLFNGVKIKINYVFCLPRVYMCNMKSVKLVEFFLKNVCSIINLTSQKLLKP